jgi:DNA-binding transcriptional LysR family regulator
VINLFQLQFFLAVAESGSFSAAAGRLHMTQPGVSQQIRGLEKHLGTQLFVRRGHGVELTAAGLDLLEPARRMMHLSEMTERTLMARRGAISGRIRLGCALSSVPFIANEWLGEFRTTSPDVTMQIEQSEPGPMLGALRAQELDGGFVMGRMRGRGLVHHRVMTDPITLIVPMSHPWTSAVEIGRAVIEFARSGEGESKVSGVRGMSVARGQASPLRPRTRPRGAQTDLGSEDPGAAIDFGYGVPSGAGALGSDGWVPAIKPGMLRDQPMVLEHGIGESHSDARRALNDALEERGLSTRDLRVVLEVPGPVPVAAAVADGLGIGMVPQSIARRFVGQVAPVRVEGLALVQHVYLIRDRKALNSPAVGAWWQFVEAKSKQQASETEAVESREPVEAEYQVSNSKY